MAEPFSRLGRLVKAVGEENLPPKFHPVAVQEEQFADANQGSGSVEDPFSKLQSVDDFVEEHEQQPTGWGDATPPFLERTRRPYQASTQQHPQSPNPTLTHEFSQQAFAFDGRKDVPAPLGISFSPFLAVTKFPYKFVRKDFMQPLASAFFDQNKIYNREWDIYYIWSDHYPTSKAITFVPEHQLLALVDEIKAAFPEEKVAVTEEHREYGLVINFDDLSDQPDLRPRWLGRSSSRDQFEYWLNYLAMPKPAEASAFGATDRSLKAFKEKMELASEISKNKSRGTKAKKQADNVAKRQNMARALLRAEKYLGLSPNNAAQVADDLPDPSNIPLSSDSDVIFIAVDVEAWERAPHYITEVGVATLDTRKIANQEPGDTGKQWQQSIRARHFIIEEYQGYINKDFVTGCPGNFEFGKSELIRKNDLGKELAKCFRPPYGGTTTEDGEEKRRIVLVGHDISQDISYLQKVGFNILNSGDIVDQIDTAELFRVYTHNPNARSLGGILYDFGLLGWNLHNAGNDAAYTIWALLAISLKAAGERGSPEESQKHAEDLEKRTEVAIQQAKERVKDEMEGWEDPEDAGGVSI